MNLKKDKIDSFKSVFEMAKPKIISMQGCLQVDLHQDIKNPEIFFTISHWANEAALENYRNSDLFITTWKQVKPLFKEKAEAWSLS
ncbi:antibiotic biosynthesis monooxygenase [Pedobacter sp. SD-b]|uniref:Antibiotic biosynthesis monooxygenase n=2 Tax=Pedobacter segetis TaxID=2793069 RepID=A0ABS1BLP7_9SPHI|nr:antibiotic biosynthesis monooxygenase [Pedobacter segetis]